MLSNEDQIERRASVSALERLAILTRETSLGTEAFLNKFVLEIAPSGFRQPQTVMVEVLYNGAFYRNRQTDEEGKTRKLWCGDTQIGHIFVAFEGREETEILPYEHELIKSYASMLSLFLANRELLQAHAKTIAETVASTEAQTRQELVSGLFHLVHDLRSPASGLELMSVHLQKDIKKFEQHPSRESLREMEHALVLMESAAKNISNLVQEIMDYAEIEAHVQPERKEIFSFSAVLHEQQKAAELLFDEKQLSLEITYDEKIPAYLNGDPLLLGRVLQNLLHNAYKFTDHGGVKVLVEVKEKQANKMCLEWTVMDTGVGIAPEDIPKMFKPFMRGRLTASKTYKSTGIGLASVKKLLERNGGSISVDSQPSQGTTFKYTLWLEALGD